MRLLLLPHTIPLPNNLNDKTIAVDRLVEFVAKIQTAFPERNSAALPGPGASASFSQLEHTDFA
jgi:hypothetical protein